MPSYDTEHFNPPAPVAHLILRNSETHLQVSDVPMLLDSGADVTLIPEFILAQLEIAPNSERRYELIGFDGSRSFSSTVQLDLIFGRKTFRGQFLVISQPFGILGRNILNAVSILLDGPGLNWEKRHPQ